MVQIKNAQEINDGYRPLVAHMHRSRQEDAQEFLGALLGNDLDGFLPLHMLFRGEVQPRFMCTDCGEERPMAEEAFRVLPLALQNEAGLLRSVDEAWTAYCAEGVMADNTDFNCTCGSNSIPSHRAHFNSMVPLRAYDARRVEKVFVCFANRFVEHFVAKHI